MQAQIGEWVKYVHTDGTMLDARIERAGPYGVADLTVVPGEDTMLNGKLWTTEFRVVDVPFSALRFLGTWHAAESPQNLRKPDEHLGGVEN
jgi:hypothetical protein